MGTQAKVEDWINLCYPQFPLLCQHWARNRHWCHITRKCWGSDQDKYTCGKTEVHANRIDEANNAGNILQTSLRNTGKLRTAIIPKFTDLNIGGGINISIDWICSAILQFKIGSVCQQ